MTLERVTGVDVDEVIGHFIAFAKYHGANDQLVEKAAGVRTRIAELLAAADEAHETLDLLLAPEHGARLKAAIAACRAEKGERG